MNTDPNVSTRTPVEKLLKVIEWIVLISTSIASIFTTFKTLLIEQRTTDNLQHTVALEEKVNMFQQQLRTVSTPYDNTP